MTLERLTVRLLPLVRLVPHLASLDLMAAEYITDEPHRGSIGDMRLFQAPGLESARKGLKGEYPGPPPSRLLGMKLTDVGLGRVTFSMPITRWLEDGFGLVWGGVYALFADAPLSWAIWTGLPAGKLATTSELNMSFVRPVTKNTTNIVGRAETIHVSRQVGLSSIQITDQDGKLLAFGSTRCLISEVPVDMDAEYPPPDTGPDDPPDPYLREAPSDGYFKLDDVLNGVPIENERKAINSDLIFPIGRLMGVRFVSVDDGYFEISIPTSPWFANGGPSVYGGVQAWLAEFTMGSAVYSTLGPGDVFASLDLNIRFTRPALINSGFMTARAHVNHRGNRLRVSSCDIRDAEGKRVAMSTSSALVVHGGARQLADGRLPDEILRDMEEAAG